MGSKKDDRNEHRRQRKRMRQIRRQREEERRQRSPAWPVDSPFTPETLRHFAAPAIEAAGSLQKALELELIWGSPEMMAALKNLVPVSRGGTLSHPGADQQWKCAVDAAVHDRQVDMAGLRRFVEQISRDR